jgi:hypothetical protein
MLDLGNETSFTSTEMYIFGLIGLQGGRCDDEGSCGNAALLAEALATTLSASGPGPAFSCSLFV